MAKFRKRPVVIEAWLWDGKTQPADWPAWIDGYDCDGDFVEWNVKSGNMWIPTLEGVHTASPGDWIIKGVAGELYPCKPDIFELTYEPE